MKNKRINKSIIYKIDKYLNGALNEEEATLFRTEIASSPTLKNIVINYKIANDAIELLVEDHTRALLN